jgi:hypothetical protein
MLKIENIRFINFKYEFETARQSLIWGKYNSSKDKLTFVALDESMLI